MQIGGRGQGGRHLLAAAIAAAMLAGCVGGNDVGNAPERSAVGIVAEGCSLTARVGSGGVVSVAQATEGERAAVVLTVAHTIKGASTITVVDADGGEHPASVLAFDKDADLAVLDAPTLSAPTLRLTERPVTELDGVAGSLLSWSRADGVREAAAEIVKRLVVTIEDIYVDEVVERTALEVAGEVTNGDSGGPVLDDRGDVVGVVYATSRRRDAVAFATDQHEIADLLDTVDGTPVDNGACF